MSVGDVYIMMFYGRPVKDNLTHSAKIFTTIFSKYSFSVPLEIEFIQCLIIFGETSQGRLNKPP